MASFVIESGCSLMKITSILLRKAGGYDEDVDDDYNGQTWEVVLNGRFYIISWNINSNGGTSATVYRAKRSPYESDFSMLMMATVYRPAHTDKDTPGTVLRSFITHLQSLSAIELSLAG
jgi:hypothetical protein